MAISPEVLAEYEQAAIPYIESQGAITAGHCRMKSWRYFLEINSACNLRCPSCTKGNMEGYDHKTGFMDPGLMELILDKIASENPQAIVFPYGNSEPFLHPQLAECIASIKRRGLNCEFASNLNHVNRLDDVLNANPDMIIISLSGFTQEVYVKGHAGGQIEKVKANMVLMAEALARTQSKTPVLVNYHLYNDNEHEADLMKAYAESLKIGFFTSFARAISMENALQYLKYSEEQATGTPVAFAIKEGHPDYNAMLPPVGQKYIDTMKRLKIPPTEAVKMYERYPIHKVCPVGDMFTFIRHDGKTSMCACVADRRLTLGDYLETSQETLSESRRGHPVCQQCLKYRMNLYFHIVDRAKWGA